MGRQGLFTNRAAAAVQCMLTKPLAHHTCNR